MTAPIPDSTRLTCPLHLRPVFRRYLWGGRRLKSVLDKNLGTGDDYAESWEVVDHGADQSVVGEGPFTGVTLRELISSHGRQLLGQDHPLPRFPLLFKFLDANRNLSVQVHPNDRQAARLEPPDLGKTEAWVILHAEPNSLIYAGLKRGFDRAAVEREVHRGTTELCLHRFEPQAGDCVFIPAGTVHALGAGLVVAEIQQASDTTFRLFDWNRVGSDGKPRELHIDQALDVINYDSGPVDPQLPQPTQRSFVSRLVECDKFILDRWELNDRQVVESDDRFHILSVIDGEVTLGGNLSECTLRKGQTILIPAAAGELPVEPSRAAMLLDMYLP